MKVSNNLSPGQFIELCSPAWARVFIEVSHDAKDDSRIPWSSSVVKDWFVRLTGFDPSKVQFADMETQHSALNAARELERALYQADEIEELDGLPALYFGSGWAAAKDFLNGSVPADLDDESIELVATRYAGAHFGSRAGSEGDGLTRNFIQGFSYRLKLGVGYVA